MKSEPGKETAVALYTRLAKDAAESSEVLLKMYNDAKIKYTPRGKALWEGYWNTAEEKRRLEKLLGEAIAYELRTGVAL